VDGIVLSGYTNQHAVEILKQTGRVVKLKIVRYLRGLRFQELQEGIAQVIQSSTGL
jgi:multiple PDZ domain protein